MDRPHRRRIRWWRCTCGRRWPCAVMLRRRDELHRTQDGQPQTWTARTAQGGVQ